MSNNSGLYGSAGNAPVVPANDTTSLYGASSVANVPDSNGDLLVKGNLAVNGGNITTTADLNGANLSLSGNIIGAVNTTFNITTTGNIAGGNVTTPGLISATGNITGGNLLTSGLISAAGNITTTGNITGNDNTVNNSEGALRTISKRYSIAASVIGTAVLHYHLYQSICLSAIALRHVPLQLPEAPRLHPEQ